MERGDILGHENMGEVIELRSEVNNLEIGDRVVVPFTISCGQCWFCHHGLFSCCDQTNPNHGCVGQEVWIARGDIFSFFFGAILLFGSLRSHSSVPARRIVRPPRTASVKDGPILGAARRACP